MPNDYFAAVLGCTDAAKGVSACDALRTRGTAVEEDSWRAQYAAAGVWVTLRPPGVPPAGSRGEQEETR